MFYQNSQLENIERMEQQLEKREKLASELDYAFNLAISEMRAYFAYHGEPVYFQKVEEQRSIVKEKLAVLQRIADHEEDRLFIAHTQDFYRYYFDDMMPKSKKLYDDGQLAKVTEIALSQSGSEMIRSYQNNLKKYIMSLNDLYTDIKEKQHQKIFVSQIIVGMILIIFIGGMTYFTRRMLRKIGKPLRNLTLAAGEIADGRTVLFTDTTERQDELGLLSKAFEKMSKSIYEKEQDLSAHNEELLAQQDTLQEQQRKLEQALESMQIREGDLQRRSDLVKGLANSLNKQEVLDSIVLTMCKILGADRGIIVLLENRHEHASFGISPEGVEQFIHYLDSGVAVRLQETQKPFAIKRESFPSEKAYHTSRSYSYDLCIPVLTASGHIEAVMMFSRYDQEFEESEIAEYDNLSKQIAISLDKLNLYEQSEQERLLTQNILDTIPEGIQLVDGLGKVVQINQKMCDMLDCHSSALMNRSYQEWLDSLLVSVENGEELKHFLNQVLFQEPFHQTSFIYHQQSPIQRVVQVHCEALTQHDEKMGTVIVHRDITKQYEVDQMKSEFVSTVSHELRTPLASVLGFTELMLNKELKPDRQKRYLSAIYQEASRLTSLINDFLDVQKMEAGKHAYDKKMEDVLSILQPILDNLELNHPNHAFQLHSQTKRTLVLADKDKLAQVFTNLMSNAIKYSPDGGNITITVFEGEGPSLCISVKDEGLGIPADALDKLFTKFYRVDNSDRRKIGGTGLGLVIVKEIVNAHGGDVTVQSVLKEGSVFTVSLPQTRETNDLPAEQTPSVLNEDQSGKYLIFIIEDDENHAKLLQAELEESQFQVKIFTHAESALSAIKIQRPDAIVLDIMLNQHEMDGWDFIKKLQEMGEVKEIPIFVSSALEEKEKGKALGVKEYLIKPYQPSKLSKSIFQVLLSNGV